MTTTVERQRIVARVEELLRWCDTLEAQLHQARTLGALILAARSRRNSENRFTSRRIGV